MHKSNISRRNFVRSALTFAAVVPVLSSCEISAMESATYSDNSVLLAAIKKNAVQHDGEWNGAKDVPADVSWKTQLAKSSDKGEKIKISGVVYLPDGKTPAPNVLIYLYHTDVDGYYGKDSSEHLHGRFRGWMLTDAKGRYEFTSIKAGQYPNRIDPAHIHFTLTSVDIKERWIEDTWFDGDDRITPAQVSKYVKSGGEFYPVVKLKKDGGVLTATRDLRLSTEAQ